MPPLLRTILVGVALLPDRALGAVFDGGGIGAGLDAAKGIKGLTQKPLREVVISIVINVLNFLALAAVVTIVVAGVWLILGFGEESARDKTKKIIIYTLIGLAIVFFARTIVGAITFILGANP